MDTARLERIQSLFHDAADLPAAEQQRLLSSECADDPALVAAVRALLEEDARGSSLLDRDVADVAHGVLGDDARRAAPVERVGPYRLTTVLGEGGMGTVYLAEREDLGSRVAIKILRDAWLSPARRERFATEQRVLAQLNHPSIARLYDAHTLADGTPCFVMEYVEGIPLTDYCRRYDCSVERCLQLFRAVCAAVQYAHQHAVIHRDLKPSNILVKADGSVRLLDFGIAKQLDALDRPADQTQTGLRFMTPAYAAPEQVRGERVGIHTDVYSLGVILYELLAGQRPFDLSNLTPAEAAAIVVDHEAARPSTHARRGPSTTADGRRVPPVSKRAWADLDVLCLTAMHKDPDRRYRSVDALLRDIDHYLSGEPLDARPDTLRYTLGKFVTRNRRAVVAAAAVVVIGVGLAAYFTIRLASARNAAVAEAARAERIQKFMMNLFEGGDDAAGPSRDLRVTTLVDRGVREARALSGDPKVQAELYQTLGSIYHGLGQLDEADSLLGVALARRRALFGEPSPEVADALLAVGLLRIDQARFAEAERLVRASLAMAKQTLPPTHPAIARATSVLGTVLEDRGAYDQAIAVLQDAVQLESTPSGPTTALAESLTELANSYFYAGRYEISDTLNRHVLAIDRQVYGDRHPNVADDFINLGAIQSQWGHYAEAERFDRQALDIIGSFYGPDHPETASALTILGRALVAQGKLDEASGLLHQALTIQEHAYGAVHPRVASALNELGSIAERQGKLAEAEADFTRMADIDRAVYGGKHYYIGVALANLAGVYVDEKQYARGEAAFRDALAMYATTLPAGHPTIGITKVRLGRALMQEHRYAEAAIETRSGYEILSAQRASPGDWRTKALSDLVTIYDSLNQPHAAATFRAELAKTAVGATR